MPAHRVNHLEVELTTGERVLAEALIERIGQLHERRIAPTLDRTFSDLSPPGQIDRIDTLELDLGPLPADDFDDAFIHALEAAVRAALSRALGERPTNRRSDVARELLAIFARTGNLPWWTADGDPDTTSADPVAAALTTLAHDAPRDLLALLHELADDPPALARLARHADDATLAPLLAHRWPAAGNDLLAAARWLATPPDADAPTSWRPYSPLFTALAHPDLDTPSPLRALLSDLARTLRTGEQALLTRLARTAHTHDAPALLREHLAPFLAHRTAPLADPPEHAPEDMPPEPSPARPSPDALRPASPDSATPRTREHAPEDMPPEPSSARPSEPADPADPTDSPATDDHTTPAPVPWAAAHAGATLDPADATDPSAREPLDPDASRAPDSRDPDTRLAIESPDSTGSHESTDPNALLAPRSRESLARHARDRTDPGAAETAPASNREQAPNEPIDTGAALDPLDPSVTPATTDPRAPVPRHSAPDITPSVASAATDPRATPSRPSDPDPAPPLASAATDPRATPSRPSAPDPALASATTDPRATPSRPSDPDPAPSLASATTDRATSSRPSAPDPATPDPATRLPPRAQPRRPTPPAAPPPPHVLAARRQALAQLDELYIDDSGLVILWPFLARLFERVDLFDDQRVFLDDAAQTRAIALLAYLAREDPDPPEFLLPLPKLLCGLAPDARFELREPLDPEVLAEGERLLAAVIDHAPVLRDMSIPGFRATFLRRRGVLAVRDGAWLLRVERAPHDLVLERFPWSWSWLKLPWMPDPLRVEW